ncbi:MAG: TetR-like C-terminal domain-containing protein, partial [Bacteroidota bacterium]
KFSGMMASLRFVDNPFERLKALGRVYMEFALTNKDLYDLMFILQAPMNNEDNEAWEEGQKALSFLKSVLHDCKAKGMFREMDIEHLSFFIWSTMHGMCALYCRNRCQAYKDHEPTELLEQGYQIFQKILTDLNHSKK